MAKLISVVSDYFFNELIVILQTPRHDKEIYSDIENIFGNINEEWKDIFDKALKYAKTQGHDEPDPNDFPTPYEMAIEKLKKRNIHEVNIEQLKIDFVL